jgi:FixJ family two-component response regulator
VKSGAIDYVQKPFSKKQLLEIVRKAFDWIDESKSGDQEFESLTPREREVLMAFNDGAPNKIVAARLDLSPRTVEMHRARIFRKLGVTNLTQALMRARDARIIG